MEISFVPDLQLLCSVPFGAGYGVYRSCSTCHGDHGRGMGNVPSLNTPKIESVPSGELFWFITLGDVNNGMPSWASLPAPQRWRIVAYLQGSACDRKET